MYLYIYIYITLYIHISYIYIYVYIYIYIYIYIYNPMYIYIHTNLPVNVIVRLPHPQSGDSQGQEGFFEVAIESWPEWDLNPRPLNSVQIVSLFIRIFVSMQTNLKKPLTQNKNFSWLTKSCFIKKELLEYLIIPYKKPNSCGLSTVKSYTYNHTQSESLLFCLQYNLVKAAIQ